MRIGIITPAPPHSLHGNRRTALRWTKLLRQLGHRVVLAETYANQPFDVLIALHAKRSFASIKRFQRLHPQRPLIVALTGTDLYRDLRRSQPAQAALEMATRLIVLQPKALEALPEWLHHKTRVVFQSVAPVQPVERDIPGAAFTVCVIGHLRAVKDPFRAALAARLLPKTSHIGVVHLGKAMSDGMAVRAEREMQRNPRYHWLGEQAPERVARLLRDSQICVNSSRLEGGANAVSEAIAAGVPVIASRVPGNVGMLGETYPGYFAAGNARELAQLMLRAETDGDFLAQLKQWCQNLAGNFLPEQELAAWAGLLAELTG